ncbi:MAG: DUF4135 domain-containing protein [Proteobacteria bacterium]|nr:MAG: DUF4135 domain-containing protein [Pseudomonadota bacterium]
MRVSLVGDCMENFAESKNSTRRCIFNLTKLKFFISTSSFESIQMIDRAGLKNFLTELSPLKMLSDHDTIQLANTYTVSEIQALIAEIDASSELENAFEISESLESHIIQRVIRTSKIKIRELKFHYSVMYDSPEEFTKNANIWIRLLLGQIKKLVQPILDENVGDLGNPFIQYPVLFKNVDSELDKFWSMLEEAHQRWQASSKENAAGLEFFSSKIVELEIQSGDPHHFGRRVLVFHTVDNSKWVYKPRSVASDIFFYDCLQWLTTKSDVTFVIPRFVDKQDYGWMEYISQEPLTVVSQAKRLFHRCGFLNAVLFILKVNDIHEENIRFSGEFPVVIDAETLFHFKAYENFQNSSYELDTTLFSHLFPVSIVDEKFPDSQTVESGINALLGLKHKFEVFSHEYQDEIADGFESALRIFKLYHQDFLLFIKVPVSTFLPEQSSHHAILCLAVTWQQTHSATQTDC